MTGGNGRQTAPAAKPEAEQQGPQMQPGMAYFMVPQPLFAETIKVLRKMPFEEVEGVMNGLSQCQPIKANPEAEEK